MRLPGACHSILATNEGAWYAPATTAREVVSFARWLVARANKGHGLGAPY